jgi:hypothetical protein
MVEAESRPAPLPSRWRSTDRIWLTITAERLANPLSSDSMMTSLGKGGSENCELIATMMVIGLIAIGNIILDDHYGSGLADLMADSGIELN